MLPCVDIVLTYFTTDLLFPYCVKQILGSTYKNIKLYIVDNTLCSTTLLRSHTDNRVVILAGDDNRRGYRRGQQHPRGIEKGIWAGSSRYVALLEADCWPIRSDWIEFCIKQMAHYPLIGLQDEGSLPLTFHFIERETLKNYNFHYTNKPTFDADDLQFVECPDIFTDKRTKWRFGEPLAIEMYRRKQTTFGLRPTKACLPRDQEITGRQWVDFFGKGWGIIYGDMIFHFGKSYRRAERVAEYLEFFKSGRYLHEYFQPSMPVEPHIVNPMKHLNAFYKTEVLERYNG